MFSYSVKRRPGEAMDAHTHCAAKIQLPVPVVVVVVSRQIMSEYAIIQDRFMRASCHHYATLGYYKALEHQHWDTHSVASSDCVPVPVPVPVLCTGRSNSIDGQTNKRING